VVTAVASRTASRAALIVEGFIAVAKRDAEMRSAREEARRRRWRKRASQQRKEGASI
jgi:hypothetical protein